MAITLISALTAAIAFRVAEDAQVARAETLRQRAFVGAESALWAAAAIADVRTLRTAPIGAVATVGATLTDLTTTTIITKVDSTILWIVAIADVTRGRETAHHRLGMSLRMASDTADLTLYPIPTRAWTELF